MSSADVNGRGKSGYTAVSASTALLTSLPTSLSVGCHPHLTREGGRPSASLAR
eukprot:CAMPEP_0113872868 /NCGR_PEP_ID=MMETSP0780_2-20120614/3452_1 /TAXON_ID=652834 /ORGANISM="Palpitomonas bilix" /LENGTH=52 /DNA_ID=CAMNT_0000858447 /DNA_START=66 /DNA_END=224 /DNA_ORIENTATION=- /assembly_acc=CAM_ASM_000599